MIIRVFNEKAEELFNKSNVTMVGVGYKTVQGKQTKDLSIVCSVDSKKTPRFISKQDFIPATISGIPTDVVQSGIIRALAKKTKPQSTTGRFRPAPGGCSVGHYLITAGTLGCWVKDKDTGEKYLLSNNHVLANSNDADIGDKIFQPGSYDGGDWADTIAQLKRFIPIDFGDGNGGGGCPIGSATVKVLNSISKMLGRKTRIELSKFSSDNLIDAAIASPVEDSVIKDEILKLGKPTGTIEGALGMEVAKYGRTTDLTIGTIQQVNAMVKVSYGQNKVAVFKDQFVTDHMSDGGDSGSAVLDRNSNKLMGLLFAGSDTSTIICRIQHVFDLLNIELI